MAMQHAAQFRWLAKSAAAAAAVLLACRAATGLIGGHLQQPAITTRDDSASTVARYLHEGRPDLVLVGSSLTVRLKEAYFAGPAVRNLALAGGSPLTGLAIVARQRFLPKMILVETNILSRPLDMALVEQSMRSDEAAPQAFRPVRAAAAAYERWSHLPADAAGELADRARLLSAPPSDVDNRVYVDRAVQQMDEASPTEDIRNNIVQLGALIVAIERRGCRVRLIEVPFSPRVDATRAAETTMAMVHAAFPDPAQWLQIEPPPAELRWADGVHLDERSALLVVQSIERALASLAADDGPLPPDPVAARSP